MCQVDQLRSHTLCLRCIDRLVQAEAALMGTSDFVQVHLQLHEFLLLRFHYFRELCYVIFCLLLINFKLRFHLEGFPLLFEEFVVRLGKKLLHLIQLMAHACILVLKVGKVCH